MKKTIKFAFVAAFAMLAGYNVYQYQSVMNNMSEMGLANVEALAFNETSRHSCKSGSPYCELYLDGNLIFSSHSHYPV